MPSVMPQVRQTIVGGGRPTLKKLMCKPLTSKPEAIDLATGQGVDRWTR